jgi:hypothetical protein
MDQATSCIAYCGNCDWVEENYDIAKQKGKEHAISLGHSVAVQEVISTVYTRNVCTSIDNYKP